MDLILNCIASLGTRERADTSLPGGPWEEITSIPRRTHCFATGLLFVGRSQSNDSCFVYPMQGGVCLLLYRSTATLLFDINLRPETRYTFAPFMDSVYWNYKFACR